jgi:hypothetical protein
VQAGSMQKTEEVQGVARKKQNAENHKASAIKKE